VIGNKIIVTSSQNVSKTALFEVSLKGASEKWRVRDFSQVGSPVIYNGCIYIVSGPLKCLDINNGQRKWQGGGFEHGSFLITAGDNKVIVFGNGQLVLVEASPYMLSAYCFIQWSYMLQR
jgi:outer membrane protein assembly factor BamB